MATLLQSYTSVAPPLKIRYEEFLRSKVKVSESHGFEITKDEINPLMEPHQRDSVWWGVYKGSAAYFLAFGLGKTIIQTETVRIIQSKVGGLGLVVLPLGVRQEFKRDAVFDSDEFRARAAELQLDYDDLVRRFGVRFKFIKSDAEITDDHTFYLTNYESVREGKVTPGKFSVVSLDEAAILADRGNKTFGEFTFEMFPEVKYKFVATATPDPNEYQELISYAAFLGVGDISQIRTRFFKRNSTKAHALTLHPHKEKEFWLWVSTWALFIQTPADLGYPDERYRLPTLQVYWHEVPSDHSLAGEEKSGQGRLVADASRNACNSAPEKRATMTARIAKLMELRAIDPGAHRLIWHDLEDERRAIEKAIPGVVSVHAFQGQKELDRREQDIIDFSEGRIQELAPKSSIAGAGCNFQRHCSWSIFFSISFQFRNFIQALHRTYRFLQTKDVRVDMIYSEAERGIRMALEEKWERYREQVAKMAAIIRKYGLSVNALQQEMGRHLGVEREEVRGRDFVAVYNDAVLETRDRMEEDSAGLILTSIPFSTQYEYSLSYNDFGATEDNLQFFQQMDYLTPNLLRVLKPGRCCVVHVKDRIQPSGLTGLGFQTLYPFHMETCYHFMSHGFALLGVKTIITDVVRENNQTYRLGYTEQCKDGSRMGCGSPEYLLIFRKPPTDHSDGYADEPVIKMKPDCVLEDGTVVPFQKRTPIIPGTGYSRSKWQLDAHGFARSDGNRLLSSEEMKRLDWGVIYRLFRSYSISHLYNYQEHVDLSEALESAGQLPTDFMLLAPQSWHPDVWPDVTRMRTLNSSQAAKNKVMHLCPLQLDIVDRIITQFSARGDLVFDPFGGIGTVIDRAVRLGRKGYACELARGYWQDMVYYGQAAERETATPTLFGLLEAENQRQEQEIFATD